MSLTPKQQLLSALDYASVLEAAAAAAITAEVPEGVQVSCAWQRGATRNDRIQTPSIEVLLLRNASDSKGGMATATATGLALDRGGRATYKERLCSMQIVVNTVRGEPITSRQLQALVSLALDPLSNPYKTAGAAGLRVEYLAHGEVNEAVVDPAVDQAILTFPLRVILPIP